MKLIAKQPIWYKGRLYVTSQELPSDASLVDAWLECNTAELVDIESSSNKISSKATAVTAEPGLPGEAVGSDADDNENLVGKVPNTKARKKAKGKE